MNFSKKNHEHQSTIETIVSKTKLTFLALLISIVSIAQNGINYKALIKDDLGNVIANTSVDIKFQILESDEQVNVYEETHSPTTDDSGIIVVNIGKGTIVSGIFDDINWGNDNHFLNVKIDSGSGFVDLGTTQFSAVPYAFHARKAENVKGLEPTDEGNGIGWRLVDRNPANYDNIGFNAIDFSFIDDPNLGLGATGNYAFSLGRNGTASGEHALTFGNQNYALNDYAVAFGNNNIVSGLNSTAIGGINLVSGDYAFAAGLQNSASESYTIALGAGVTASGEYAIAMGQNVTASGANSMAFGRNTEAIGERSVAMGSGAEAQGNFSFAFGDESEAQGNNSIAMGNDAFATNEDAVAIGRDAFASGISSFATGFNSDATGSYSTAMGYGATASASSSTAMGNSTLASGGSSTAIGNNTEASGGSSTAMGSNTIASGLRSTAMGNSTLASEFDSTAMGLYTVASGGASTAMGVQTEASGDRSTAMGSSTEASGDNSTAMGVGTNSVAFISTVLGSYNIGGGTSDNWVASDPLFEIGNGLSDASRSNAVTVLKNGNVGIGNSNPQELLHVSGMVRIGSETIADTGNNRLSFNADLLPDSDNSFRLGNSTTRWTSVWAADGSINTSDRREKTNIKTINYGLNEVLKMNPVSFNWKNRINQGTKLGLIAQDLLELVPEVVKTHEWQTTSDDENAPLEKVELDRLGVYYSDLVPVLINAIKEQQDIIQTQNERINRIETQLTTLLEPNFNTSRKFNEKNYEKN
ncbi:MAG: tail fiber domain-containing protein [Winogradskyella sp.]|nr:tail fiber domain-containing protein [Winogradskyella sp.]